MEKQHQRVQGVTDKEDRDTWRQGKGLREIECGSDREPQKDPTRNRVTETGRDSDTRRPKPETHRETETRAERHRDAGSESHRETEI